MTFKVNMLPYELVQTKQKHKLDNSIFSCYLD